LLILVTAFIKGTVLKPCESGVALDSGSKTKSVALVLGDRKKARKRKQQTIRSEMWRIWLEDILPPHQHTDDRIEHIPFRSLMT